MVREESPEGCPFCRIVRGEGQAEVLYRDEEIVAFRDVHPVAPIHVLIIPQRHVDSLDVVGDDSPGLLDHMGRVARLLAAREGVSSSGYRLVINTGGDAGQSVFHLHMHMLAGRRMNWPPG